MMNPLVSVVIPTHNREEGLPEAVHSVLDQTVDDLEIIVVDDYSATPARDVLEEIDDDRLTVLRHEQNRNGAAARNTGIDHATGEYITFLDDDDTWKPEKLERQLTAIEQSPADVKACYTYLDYILDGEHEIVGDPYEGDIRTDLLLRQVNGGFGSSLLVEADVVERVGGFDERFDRHQDWEFLMAVLEHCRIAVVQEPLVTIEGEYGVTDGATLEEAKELLLEKYSDYIEGLPWTTRRKINATHRLEVAQSYAYHCHIGKSMASLTRSILSWPLTSPTELARTFFYMVSAKRE